MNHVVTLGLTAALAWGVWAVLADVAVRSLPPESTMILSYGASVVLAAGYVAVPPSASSPRCSRVAATRLMPFSTWVR